MALLSVYRQLYSETSLLPFRLFTFKGTVSSLNRLIRAIGSTRATRIQQVEIRIETPRPSVYTSGNLFWNGGAFQSMSVEESEDIVRCVKGLRGIQHVEIYLKHGGFVILRVLPPRLSAYWNGMGSTSVI